MLKVPGIDVSCTYLILSVILLDSKILVWAVGSTEEVAVARCGGIASLVRGHHPASTYHFASTIVAVGFVRNSPAGSL